MVEKEILFILYFLFNIVYSVFPSLGFDCRKKLFILRVIGCMVIEVFLWNSGFDVRVI